MSERQREIYHSENGDRWFLSRGEERLAFILHKANPSARPQGVRDRTRRLSGH